ncbi:non-structural maintenance of chromosomes element 1 homolog [Mucor ambiguus]|uniref:Non-structural maintenance of chromosomes element 1 homolog n=1 Tax=Mucor ambiguus TaxID=91626 RepID=A0A0C9MDD3_9FUNG|nr:non-structural maintenance of chromosomes element 1 homolog [Mucor ambiguus]
MHKPYPTSTSATRRRTHLKPSQVAVLQETFVTNTLPDAAVRSQLAHELDITERTVQIWFQNRRAKARKLEASSGGSMSSLVPNVRTGWIDLPKPTQQHHHHHHHSHQSDHPSSDQSSPFHSLMTTDTFENQPTIKRRPRSCSKPEKTTTFLLSTPPQRAMSEGMGRVETNQDAKPIVSFPVQGIRIGTWARFARQISSNEWDLFCFSDPTVRQLIWQVQDGGHQFRIEVDFENIQQIRLGQIQNDIGQLDIDVQPKSIISFSMRRSGIDQDWVRCNDFTENQQASSFEAGSHALQGSHDNLRQSLLELISQAPDLAAKLVIIPDNNYLCRDLTISPSATPEPSFSNMNPVAAASAAAAAAASWLVDPAKIPWNPYPQQQQYQQQQQEQQQYQQQPSSYDASFSWPHWNMLQQQQQDPNHSEQHLLTNQQHDPTCVDMNSFFPRDMIRTSLVRAIENPLLFPSFEAMSQFNDSHRLFMQSMLSKKMVTEQEAMDIYAKVCNVTSKPADVEFPSFVSVLNKELDKLDYSLRLSRNEQDGVMHVIMVNTNQDTATELATQFTAIEMAFIRELFDLIINADDEDFGVSATTALHLGGKMTPKLASRDVQTLLDKLVEDGWIGEQKGNYFLTTRSVAELQDYFKQLYGESILECIFCLDMVTMGEHCANAQCSVRLHKHCADSQFNNSADPRCPSCSSRWSRGNTFGLGLPDDEEDA